MIPNARVKVKLTPYGRNKYFSHYGWDPGSEYKCTLWVVMNQLGPLLKAGFELIFSDIEEIK